MLALLLAAAAPLAHALRVYDVKLHRDGAVHTLRVPDNVPVLHAVEAAGLLPGSDCRRGNCLSCAARVRCGNPFSLRVADDSALCEEAHVEGVVLLCSSYVSGPGLELDLDADELAWDIQHRKRFSRDAVTPPPIEERPTEDLIHYRSPADLLPFLERSLEADF